MRADVCRMGSIDGGGYRGVGGWYRIQGRWGEGEWSGAGRGGVQEEERELGVESWCRWVE